LAGLLLFGYRVWPGIWLGAFLTHIATFFDGSSSETVLRSLSAAAGNGLGEVLQATAGGWLVLRLVNKTPSLASLKEVLVLTAPAGLIGSSLSSTVTAAITAISAAGYFWTTWWAGWRANSVGVLVFAPPVLIIAQERSRVLTSLRFRPVAEAAVLLVGFLIHAFFLTEMLGDLLSAGFVALFLSWATLRFATLGTALGMLMIALVLMWNVKKGDILLGAIYASAEWRVLTAQTILAFLGLTFWSLAAVQQDRQRIMRALRDNEARYRSLVELSPDAVLILEDDRISYCNPAGLTLFGAPSLEAMLGKPVGAFLQPDDRAPSAVRRRMERETGRAKHLCYYCACRLDGALLDVESRLGPCMHRGKAAVQVVIRDITERKRLEQGLRFLSDASVALAALVDYESTLQKVASLAVPYFADWCTVDLAEPGGQLRRVVVAHVDPAKVRLAQELQRRYPPDPEAPHGPYHVLRTGASEMMAEIPDGVLIEAARDTEHLRILRELGLKSCMCVLLRPREKPLGVLTFIAAESGKKYTPADLAFAEELCRRAAIAIENVQLYADLRKADRLKDEFLAMLAHELRNPLAPLRNALHIMKQPGTHEAVIGQCREMADRQVQHMARLLDDLLDVSRVSRGKIELRKESVDMAAVLHATVEGVRPLMEGRGHQFTMALPSEPLQVEGDPTRLEQVLTNLLNNAAKYTDPGGRIWLLASRDGAEIVLRVRDTGIGIDPEMLPRIFDLFVQAERRLDRSQGGVGIGLTLVRKLVELHGGSVEAYSAGLGWGSEFVVRLPALAAEPQSRQTEAGGGTAPASALARHRVLAVDDNVDAADSLAMLLRLAGHEVRVAYDGPTALLIAQTFQPQVIFLDIGMPCMDGYDVARRLREDPELKPAVLVAMTGWGQEEDRRRSLQAGFDHHLVKPVEMEELEQVLHGKQ
jgi:PAS domain S-box-containing protein